MTDPRSLSALTGEYQIGWHGAQSGLDRLTLCERSGSHLLLVRGKPADSAFVQGFEAALGCEPPTAPGTTVTSDDAVILWLGPDEWLVSGTVSSEGTQTLARCAGAVTDISHGRTVLRIRGRNARELLAKGLPLDLHPRAFSAGRCAQSALARCNVLVHQVDEAPTFDLYVMRSYGRSLWHFLCAAGAELGYEVIAPTS